MAVAETLEKNRDIDGDSGGHDGIQDSSGKVKG
jgi:hypothetical protein